MGIEDKYNNLNIAEKIFLWSHPFAAISFNANATAALEEAKKRFSPATLHNGSGDAFRHCFWSAMNARDQGKDMARTWQNSSEMHTRIGLVIHQTKRQWIYTIIVLDMTLEGKCPLVFQTVIWRFSVYKRGHKENLFRLVVLTAMT